MTAHDKALARQWHSEGCPVREIARALMLSKAEVERVIERRDEDTPDVTPVAEAALDPKETADPWLRDGT